MALIFIILAGLVQRQPPPKPSASPNHRPVSIAGSMPAQTDYG
jgi:hypothetical protein